MTTARKWKFNSSSHAGALMKAWSNKTAFWWFFHFCGLVVVDVCCVYHFLRILVPNTSSEIWMPSWKKFWIAEALLQLRCPFRKDLNSIVAKCYVLVYDSVRRTFDYYLHCKCLWQLEIICKSWSLLLRFWIWFFGRFQRTLFLCWFLWFLFFLFLRFPYVSTTFKIKNWLK